MLSRIAESLFWIGRYTERADGTARIVDVLRLQLLEDPGADEVLASNTVLSVIMGMPWDGEATFGDVSSALVFDRSNASSITGAWFAAQVPAQHRNPSHAELHRLAGRARDVLRAQEADEVAATLDIADRFELARALSGAARSVAFAAEVGLRQARGALPHTMAEVEQREKEIRFSSRTRLNTDEFRARHAMSRAARRLRARLPQAMRQDPDLMALIDGGPIHPVSLMHLIYRHADYESASKDYEFSRLSMLDHWRAGLRDVERSLRDPRWTERQVPEDGLFIFDRTEPDGEEARLE